MSRNTRKRSSNPSLPTALGSKHKLKPLDDMEILSSLPSPNYKPLPNRELMERSVDRVDTNKRKTRAVSDDMSLRVQSKKGRTAVFAGQSRTGFCTHVSRLEDLCVDVLMNNIDKIYSFGDAPYYLIKPILRKCTPKQLSRIEHYNPSLVVDEETDEIWKELCNKEFREKEIDYDVVDNWRDLYTLAVKERDDRLKDIAANITKKQAKALPVRQTQLAFGDNPKPPRDVLRKQEKAAMNAKTGISSRVSGVSNGYSSGSYSSGSSSSSSYVRIAPEKPKVGPLMKKALQMQKARFRR